MLVWAVRRLQCGKYDVLDIPSFRLQGTFFIMHAINLEVEKGLVAGRGDYRGLSSPRRWHQPQSTYAFFAASGILAFTLGFSNVVAVEDRTGSLWSQLLCWCIIFVLVDAWHYFKAGGDWRLLKPGGESNGRSEALAFIITLLSVIPTFARVLWAFVRRPFGRFSLTHSP